MKTMGVLALQGGYDAHLRALNNLGVPGRLVRTLDELENVSGLIIPGGESTTMGKLLDRHTMIPWFRQRIQEGFPIFGTCAGMILLADRVQGPFQPLLGGLDITVLRNAYGRQIESFETKLVFNVSDRDSREIPAMFIRAPRILDWGPGVEVLSVYEDSPVAVRHDRLLAASFHPELTDDLTVLQYFVSQVAAF